MRLLCAVINFPKNFMPSILRFVLSTVTGNMDSRGLPIYFCFLFSPLRCFKCNVISLETWCCQMPMQLLMTGSLKLECCNKYALISFFYWLVSSCCLKSYPLIAYIDFIHSAKKYEMIFSLCSCPSLSTLLIELIYNYLLSEVYSTFTG